jgi:hypothetical protein
MPAFIREALNARELVEAYRARPPYQQNDSISAGLRAPGAQRRRRSA